MQRIITPTHYVPLTELSGKPVFFIAGPIRGGDDWQADMCRILGEKAPEAVPVCPCRWNTSHSLAPCFMPGAQDRFANQTEWERFYLARAGFAERRNEEGCVIFYLPLESEHNPRPKEEGPYAQDTYGELGEWRAWMAAYGAQLVVGADPCFPGLRTIRRNFEQLIGREFPIYPSIRTTAAAAVRMARR